VQVSHGADDPGDLIELAAHVHDIDPKRIIDQGLFS